MASYRETIRLDPQNDWYAGIFHLFLCKNGHFQEAENFEQAALQGIEKKGVIFARFVWSYFILRKYKKAQEYINEAFKLDPGNEMISVLFKTIYPTKNPVVQAMRAVNGILWIYPIDFFWRLFKEKVSDGTIAAILYFLVFVAVAVIFQEKFLIALVIYLLLLFISLKLENRILKKAGFKGNAIVRMNSWGQTAAREAMKNAFDNRHAHAVSLHEPETNHQQRIP